MSDARYVCLWLAIHTWLAASTVATARELMRLFETQARVRRKHLTHRLGDSEFKILKTSERFTGSLSSEI